MFGFFQLVDFNFERIVLAFCCCYTHYNIAVHLNKGWNKVFLKLPVGKFNMPEVRLVKWMFTTVFVTPDGENAVDGLIYSPDKTK